MKRHELIEIYKNTGMSETSLGALAVAYDLGAAHEREALLDLAYSYADSLTYNDDFQAAIRARGQS